MRSDIMKNNKKKNRESSPKEVPEIICELSTPSKTDPNGSWTGVPKNKSETPTQDVDDL